MPVISRLPGYYQITVLNNEGTTGCNPSATAVFVVTNSTGPAVLAITKSHTWELQPGPTECPVHDSGHQQWSRSDRRSGDSDGYRTVGRNVGIDDGIGMDL